jgi:hypothetical protein
VATGSRKKLLFSLIPSTLEGLRLVAGEVAELTITVDTFLNKTVDETEIRQLIAFILLIKLLKIRRNYEYYFYFNMVRGHLDQAAVRVANYSNQQIFALP